MSSYAPLAGSVNPESPPPHAEEVAAQSQPAPSWSFVDECATRIRNLRREINAAEKNIAIGGVFKEIKASLLRHSRYDKKAPGWVNIFSGSEGQRRFGCNRRHAERHILLHDAFALHVGPLGPTCDLPSGFKPLTLLARLVLDEKWPSTLLARYLDEGRIHPGSTEREIRAIGMTLGILNPKPRPVGEPAEEPEPAFDLRSYMEKVGIAVVLASLPKGMRCQCASICKPRTSENRRARRSPRPRRFPLPRRRLLSAGGPKRAARHRRPAVSSLSDLPRKRGR